MKELFLEYEDALALKELGFDEPCLVYYDVYDDNIWLTKDDNVVTYNCTTDRADEGSLKNYNTTDFYLSAPLYQQAFKFFREKYQLHPEIIVQLGFEHWNAHILPHGMWLKPTTPTGFETYEEAEKACVKQLIKLAKNEL